jgi:hypothetical protein
MWKRLPRLALLVCVAALGILIARRWNGVGPANYNSVQPGMTQADVWAILGEPAETVSEMRFFYPSRNSKRIRLQVYRWYAPGGAGRIEVGFDENGITRWKNYEPTNRPVP